MKPQRTYLIYDGRARLEGPDEATVIDTAESLEEAQRIRTDVMDDACIFSYIEDRHGVLVDGRMEPDE